MSRFLLVSYDALTEIALWLLFVGAAISGYYAAGIGGAIGFLVGAFIISVFLVAPFMMISDIRKTVARIEQQKSQLVSASQRVPSHMQPASGQAVTSHNRAPTTQNRRAGHIKNYKGYEFIRGESGVLVDGNKFDDVLKAEKWVNEQVKKG